MRFKIEVFLALAFGGSSLIGFIIPLLGYVLLFLACAVLFDIVANWRGYAMKLRFPLVFQHKSKNEVGTEVILSQIQFFEQRQPSEWWEARIRSARNIWAMYLIGGRTHNDELLKTANFKKLVLLHPDNAAVKAIKQMESEKSLRDLQGNIRNLTEMANKKQCDVHWCDDIAYSLITIGNPPNDKDSPPPDDMWVYVETYVPGIEARMRPSFLVERSKNQKLADNMLASFNKLWAHTKPPDSSPNPDKGDSQP